MHNTVLHERGVGVRGLVRGFYATSLIDGDIDDDCTRFHRPDHVFAYDSWRATTGNKYGTDDKVGVGYGSFYRPTVRGDGGDATHLNLINMTKAVDVLVE
jgi:hypothetical protein